MDSLVCLARLHILGYLLCTARLYYAGCLKHVAAPLTPGLPVFSGCAYLLWVTWTVWLRLLAVGSLASLARLLPMGSPEQPGYASKTWVPFPPWLSSSPPSLELNKGPFVYPEDSNVLQIGNYLLPLFGQGFEHLLLYYPTCSDYLFLIDPHIIIKGSR